MQGRGRERKRLNSNNKKRKKLPKKKQSALVLGKKVSAQTRCLKWVQQMPAKEKWSRGATPSTITLADKPIKRKSKRSLLFKRQINKKIKEIRQVKQQDISYPKVSAKKANKSCKKKSDKSKLEKNRQQYQFTKPADYSLSCKKCFRLKWKKHINEIHREAKRKFIYHKKHRTNHFINKDKYPSSLGWSILQAIKLLRPKRQAYPVKIHEHLKQKLAFKHLSLVAIKQALGWMEKNNLIMSKPGRVIHNPSEKKTKKGKRRDIRIMYKHHIPYGVGIRTKRAQLP